MKFEFLKLKFVMKFEFQKLEFFEKYTLKNFKIFSTIFEFYKLEYYGKLDFTKFEYPKSGKFLYIFEIVVDCNIVCENELLGYFRQSNYIFYF